MLDAGVPIASVILSLYFKGQEGEWRWPVTDPSPACPLVGWEGAGSTCVHPAQDSEVWTKRAEGPEKVLQWRQHHQEARGSRTGAWEP